MKKSLIFIILALVILGGAIYARLHRSAPEIKESPSEDVRAMSIEDYIKLHISELSTAAGAPEVLGGTFYINSIEAKDGVGTVSYEDGHNAYTAGFSYTIDGRGYITINSFTVRQ
jgi:hypothetical protein